MIAVSVVKAHILLNIFVAMATEEMDAEEAKAGGVNTDEAAAGEARRLDPYEEVEELTVAVDPAKVHISATRNGQSLTSFSFPIEIVGPYGRELIESLESSFPVTLTMADGALATVDV